MVLVERGSIDLSSRHMVCSHCVGRVVYCTDGVLVLYGCCSAIVAIYSKYSRQSLALIRFDDPIDRLLLNVETSPSVVVLY